MTTKQKKTQVKEEGLNVDTAVLALRNKKYQLEQQLRDTYVLIEDCLVLMENINSACEDMDEAIVNLSNAREWLRMEE